jgi:hypothetical protein
MIGTPVDRGVFDRSNFKLLGSSLLCVSIARRVTRSGNQEQLLLPIAGRLRCGLGLFMRDEDAEALNELVLERRRLIRRLDELNDMLLEVDLRTIEPALRKGSIPIH